MLNLLKTLEMRKHLRRLKKADRVISICVYGGDPVFVRTQKIGWFTVQFDILDADEETWLASEIIYISEIFAINDGSVDRSRVRLMLDNAEPGEEIRVSYRRPVHEDDEEMGE